VALKIEEAARDNDLQCAIRHVNELQSQFERLKKAALPTE
jgi:hypothetical protein